MVRMYGIGAPFDAISQKPGEPAATAGPRFPARPTLAALALALAAGAAAGALVCLAVVALGRGASLGDPAGVASSLVRIAAYAVAAAVLIARLPSLGGDGLTALGLRVPSAGEIGAIAGGAALVAVLRYLAFLYLAALHIPGHIQTGLEHFAVTGALGAVLAIAVAATIAPFAEEVFFRGVVYGALAVRLSPLRAGLASAVLFAASRGDIALLPFFTAYGLVLAALYRRTGNLAVPIGIRVLLDGGSTALLVWLDLALR
jgi:membrane protease YdiL (CAAX protease family)